MEVKEGTLVVTLIDGEPLFGLVRKVVSSGQGLIFDIETSQGEIPAVTKDILPLAQTDGSIRIPVGAVETYQADVIFNLALEVSRLKKEVSELKRTKDNP